MGIKCIVIFSIPSLSLSIYLLVCLSLSLCICLSLQVSKPPLPDPVWLWPHHRLWHCERVALLPSPAEAAPGELLAGDGRCAACRSAPRREPGGGAGGLLSQRQPLRAAGAPREPARAGAGCGAERRDDPGHQARGPAARPPSAAEGPAVRLRPKTREQNRTKLDPEQESRTDWTQNKRADQNQTEIQNMRAEQNQTETHSKRAEQNQTGPRTREEAALKTSVLGTNCTINRDQITKDCFLQFLRGHYQRQV